MKTFRTLHAALAVATLAIGLFCMAPAAALTVSYTYDGAGRLTKMAFASGQRILYTYDPAGNILKRQSFDRGSDLYGDVNGDGNVNLTDMVTVLQLQADLDRTREYYNLKADVNGDNRIGSAEAVYILQKTAELR
jgi:YD repeat-containing protein